ncbi:aspartate-alanine antiporter [Roseiarcus fermentans]|uniref:Aspartate-alanine antiporter n=1 Tax=Roseiarcus fermentans TaxID=1473586 RepID=A0A366F8U4_9HYPH|nr:aspartate-alanine antiporter [Roseiarcus fermentans]RBP10370.1 aspartate-alanine antiporter [Roseiarcus fermentans]
MFQDLFGMLKGLLSERPELAIFAALIVGYAVGGIKFGPFQLGGVAGTLIAALVIGQVGVAIDPSLQRFMFTLFIYALGFSVAPQFFASVDRTTWTWGLLVGVEVVLIVVVAFVATWLFKLDVGTASGLLAGSATESAMVGTASEAIGRLGLATDVTKAQQANVASAYALSYIFSLITIVLFASQLAPRLLGINLRAEARKVMAKLGGADENLDADQTHSFPSFGSRGFRVAAAAGKTVAALETELSGASTIEGIRRGATTVPVLETCLLETGDEVAVTGPRATLADAARVFGPELGAPADVDFIVETRDVVLTRRDMHRTDAAAIVDLLRASHCRGVYLAGIKRMDRSLPPLPGAKVRTGDVLRLYGKPEDVARAARLLGEAEAPNDTTDFVYLGGGLVLGILIGLVTVPLAGVPLALGSAGALLSGLGFGWLRSRRPTFGRFPPAASQILKDLGLSVYIAAIGLTSATSVVALLRARGWELPVSAIFISLVPTTASIYIGRYLLHMEPAILCGAIAGQQASTPAIKATEAAAGNSVPVVGYTVTYAIANVLLPLLGPLFVAAFAAMNIHAVSP